MINQKPIHVAVVLAAGSSSRMGQPKQLLQMGNESLIRKIVKETIASGCDKVFVVLGSNRVRVENEIKDLPIEIVFNEDWNKGMGSSIKCGLNQAMKISQIESIVFILCDQPRLNSFHLGKLKEEHRHSQFPIIASRYADSIGVPALFHKSVFQKLETIEDTSGAKKIIEQNPALVKSVDFPEGEIDLDTPEDWKKFIQGISKL
ncbi:MAG: nucleotidyltransferase family protein [Cyclobacteriaceae bacterium]